MLTGLEFVTTMPLPPEIVPVLVMPPAKVADVVDINAVAARRGIVPLLVMPPAKLETWSDRRCRRQSRAIIVPCW